MSNLLKVSLKSLVSYLKHVILGDKLNYKEAKGFKDRSTKFKLLPYSNIQVPFSLGRTIRGVSFFESVDNDPFALFCKKCLHGESDVDLGDHLYSLYKKESSKSAAEIVGYPDNLILAKYPAWSLVMPWERITLQEKHNAYLNNFVANRSEHGAQFTKSQMLSAKQVLYSYSNAQSQVSQTKHLWESIRLNGVLPRKPLPGVIIMYDDKCWRWFMSGDGNHRSYLSYLYGSTMFFAEIQGAINRRDVNSWTNVKNGTYNQLEALQLFDSFFNGKKICRGLV